MGTFSHICLREIEWKSNKDISRLYLCVMLRVQVNCVIFMKISKKGVDMFINHSRVKELGNVFYSKFACIYTFLFENVTRFSR